MGVRVEGASKGGLVRVGRDRGGPPGQTKAKNRAEGVKNGIQMKNLTLNLK